MPELAFLKIGGSLITDKSSERAFRADRARSVAREVREALDAAPQMRLLLGHGAGCFGHVPAKRWRVNEGLPASSWEGFARTRRSVMELNGLVLDAFAEEGLFPVFVQPSAVSVARRGKLADMDLRPVKTLLAAGQVPMVCGDAVLDEAQGFAIVGTEGFFAYMAERLRPSRIVLACDVDGVRDADPRITPHTNRIERLEGAAVEEAVARMGGATGLCKRDGCATERGGANGMRNRDGCATFRGGAGGADVTGGMAGKVKALAEMARLLPDAEARIVSGAIPGQVRDALLGRGGGTLVSG